MDKKTHRSAASKIHNLSSVTTPAANTLIMSSSLSAKNHHLQQQMQQPPLSGAVPLTTSIGAAAGGGGAASSRQRSSSTAAANPYHHYGGGQRSPHSGSVNTPGISGTMKSNNNNSNSHHNNSGNNSKALACPSPQAMVTTTNTNNNNNVVEASGKTITVTRNKNDEAINDLRKRIPEIENIFDVHSRIGNGTFSTVLLGTLKKERDLPENMRRKFAIKHHIPTSHPDRIMKELQCMAKIGGTDNVVGINCCIRYNESVAFIMPYMQHDRFHDFFNKMELAELQHYMKNLLIALRHVHKFNVIHRDVKPSNFLYNRRKRQFLLVDFGLAQQVPASLTAASGAIESGCELSVPSTPAALQHASDGKRPREHDEPAGSKPCDLSSGDVRAGAKRLRCTGPQGDQASNVTNPNNNTNSGGPGGAASGAGGNQFKMPLKQINETVGKTSGVTLTANNSVSSTASSNANNGDGNTGCEPSISRQQAKSNMLTAGVSGRMPQKMRLQGGANTHTRNTSSITQSTHTPESMDTASSKYNTNRNLAQANGSKCICYGNPQVCNICLIKKEIHASRAGTPGYRPPEVLLKYADQTTAVDVWAAGVIFLSILSSVYPFFKAPNDFVALAEMVTIFGDKTIRKTAFLLDRLVTLSQRTKPLDLRKLCVRFRNRVKFSSPELLKKYQRSDGTCEVCRNCDQFYFNCLCAETNYNTEPLDDDDPFPASAYDLLYKLLEVNPHHRITAEEALKHPFFSEPHGKTPAVINLNLTLNHNNNNNNNNNNANKEKTEEKIPTAPGVEDKIRKLCD